MSLQSRIQVAGHDGTEPEASPEAGKPAPERSSVVSDPFADLKTRVHKDIIARLGPRLFNGDATKGDNDLDATVNEAVTEVLALEKTPLTRQERQDIIRQISDDILGYGPLEPFLRDDSITEVMVNDCRTIYIERHGKITRTYLGGGVWMAQCRYRDTDGIVRKVQRLGPADEFDKHGKLVRVAGEGLKWIPAAKSDAGLRTMALPRFAVDMLEKRRNLPYFGEQAMIFPSTAGTWRDPNNFAKQWRTAREDLGVPEVTTHSFRKTVADLIDEQGLSARVGADQLGHAKPSMTQDRYMTRGPCPPRGC